MSHMDSDDIDKKSLEMFLSDVEDDVKFLAIQLSRARKANLVEKRDVKMALRKLLIELLRSRRIFLRHHKWILRDMNTVKEGLESLKTPRILDVGCGLGRASRRLSRLLDEKAEFVGIDLDILSIEYGKFLNRSISFLRSHMSYLPFKSGIFGAILSSRALHEIEEKDERKKAFSEFTRILKQEGLIYIFEPFARSNKVKTLLIFLHKRIPRIEMYNLKECVEELLKKYHFKIVSKYCISWSTLSLNLFCSFIATKHYR